MRTAAWKGNDKAGLPEKDLQEPSSLASPWGAETVLHVHSSGGKPHLLRARRFQQDSLYDFDSGNCSGYGRSSRPLKNAPSRPRGPPSPPVLREVTHSHQGTNGLVPDLFTPVVPVRPPNCIIKCCESVTVLHKHVGKRNSLREN